MADVYDQWHRSRPKPGEPECREHPGKVPTESHGKGKRWQVRYRDANSVQKKENFAKKGEADARAAEVETDLRRGQYVDPKLGKQSFRTVAEQWRTNSVHRASTADRVNRGLKNHVYPLLGDRPIAAIRTSEIRRWVKDRSEVLAPSTLRVNYSYIVSVFRTAILDHIINVNPCEPVELPEILNQEVEALPIEVVEALIAGMTLRYRALLKLAAGSGLRQGELFALEVDHVDFLRRSVRVQQQLIHSDHGGDPYIGPLKTKQSYRTVPVAAFLVDEVAAFLTAFPPREVELWDRTDPRKPVLRKARLVFTNTNDRAIRRGAWSKVWATAVHRANERLAPSGLVVPSWASMHSFRHFYASLLILAGENVKTVQKRLGHAQPSITLNTYAHMWPDAEDTSRAAVEAAFGQGSALNVPSPKLSSVKSQVRAAS